MSGLNIKDFLTCGSFLQIGPDLFKIITGPFVHIGSLDFASLKHTTLFYKPNFWDFLNNSQNFSQNSVYSGVRTYTLDREEFIGLLAAVEARKPEFSWEPPDEESFRAQFKWSQKNFSDKKLSKTVPIICQQARAQMTQENLAWCLMNLLSRNNGGKNFGWSYGYFEKNSGILGHTPELLANWMKEDGQLHTVALAGTYEKNDEAHKKILNDQKIRQEHQIVIDDIIEKLSFLKTDIIQDETEVLELKHLLHLYTQFQVQVDSVHQALQVVKHLHPTSAMGIYPSDTGKFHEFSEFGLQKNRGSFAAPFAVIEKDAVYCVVAIRNLIFTDDRVNIFSGCGVTAESQYELELAELKSKRESVKKMLGLEND